MPDPRTYVLDTCVLLADAKAMFRFEEHEVVLPLVVIEELDRNKTRLDEIGHAARGALRAVEELRVRSPDGLSAAVALPSGGTLRVERNHTDVELPEYLDPTSGDHRILKVARGLRATLVTRDTALRVKGSQLGVAVEDYRADTVNVEEPHTGVAEVTVPADVIDRLYAQAKTKLPRDVAPLVVNEGLVLRATGSQSALARVVDVAGDGTVTAVPVRGRLEAFGVTGRDVRQKLALDLLLDPEISCVSLMGMAGTGKTLLALAAGLEQTVETGIYRRASIYRPLVAVGRQEVGYLPGDLHEKLAPWMAAVHDNLYTLFRGEHTSADHVQGAVDELLARGQLEMAAVTYLRGRSITDEFVIVDEAQNLELPTLKVILTRMAQGAKVVFCGDLSQVDNPYISPYGGMAALIEKLKGNRLFGHVQLAKGQRSPLAELAALTF